LNTQTLQWHGFGISETHHSWSSVCCQEFIDLPSNNNDTNHKRYNSNFQSIYTSTDQSNVRHGVTNVLWTENGELIINSDTKGYIYLWKWIIHPGMGDMDFINDIDQYGIFDLMFVSVIRPALPELNMTISDPTQKLLGYENMDLSEVKGEKEAEEKGKNKMVEPTISHSYNQKITGLSICGSILASVSEDGSLILHDIMDLLSNPSLTNPNINSTTSNLQPSNEQPHAQSIIITDTAIEKEKKQKNTKTKREKDSFDMNGTNISHPPMSIPATQQKRKKKIWCQRLKKSKYGIG